MAAGEAQVLSLSLPPYFLFVLFFSFFSCDYTALSLSLSLSLALLSPQPN